MTLSDTLPSYFVVIQANPFFLGYPYLVNQFRQLRGLYDFNDVFIIQPYIAVKLDQEYFLAVGVCRKFLSGIFCQSLQFLGIASF